MAARREEKSRGIKYQIVDRYSTMVQDVSRYRSKDLRVPLEMEYDGNIQGFGFDS